MTDKDVEDTTDSEATEATSSRGKHRKDTGPVMRAGVKLVERAFSGSNRPQDPDTDVFAPSNFRQVNNSWWLDRVLPGDVKRYFITTIVICTVVWLIALFLRLSIIGFGNLGEDLWNFVKSRQWQMQPLLLLVHFVCLRLFKGIYSRNFDNAFRHLDVRPKELQNYRRWFNGARVNFMAMGVAAPFIIWEWVQFATTESFYQMVYGADAPYLQQIDLGARNVEAYFLLALWTFEWMMYGYYCYLMVSGALIVRGILKNHDFKDSVDLVLTERQYRPLFNVTAQAGSLVFFYGLIHGGYLLYTKSTGSDIAGMIVLVVLLGLAIHDDLERRARRIERQRFRGP